MFQVKLVHQISRVATNVFSRRMFSIEACQTLGFDVDVDYFHENGVGVVKSFATKEECEGMMQQMRSLIEKWDPADLVVFRTDDQQIENQGNSDYFLDSADGIALFLEPAAVDEKTGLLQQGRTKHESLNKVGHGLHVQDPVFREYSTSERVSALTRALGWVDPVLPQR